MRSKIASTCAALALIASAGCLAIGHQPKAHASLGVTGAARIYWGENGGTHPGLYWKALDGTGSATQVSTAGATATDMGGLTLDPRAGYAYWTNCGAALTVSRTSLYGSGGTDLANTTAGGCPWGIVVNHATNKLMYVDWIAGGMYKLNLDGSSLVQVTPTGVSSINRPSDLVIDETNSWLYWSNDNPPRFARANTSSLAGSDIGTSPVVVGSGNGVAIDRQTGRMYWTDFDKASVGAAALGYTNSDGSGSGVALTPGSPRPYGNPQGLALDAANNYLYWSSGDKITRTTTSGTGSVDIQSGAGSWVSFMAILTPPVNTVTPAVTGTATTGSTLTCGTGTWEMDRAEAHYFDAPASYAYDWQLGGVSTGATTQTITANSVGMYSCLVTATNAAGSNTVASSTLSVGLATTTTSTVAPTTTSAAPSTSVASPTTTVTTVAGSTTTTSPHSVTTTTAAAHVSSKAAATTTSTSTTTTTTTTIPELPSSTKGQVTAHINGVDTETKVQRSDNALVIAAGSITATIKAVSGDGKTVPLDSSGSIKFSKGDYVSVTAQGFAVGTKVDVWLHSTPAHIGTFEVDTTGTGAGKFAIPANASEGNHSVVLIGQTSNSALAQISVGVALSNSHASGGLNTLLLIPILIAVLAAIFIPTSLRRRRKTAST